MCGGVHDVGRHTVLTFTSSIDPKMRNEAKLPFAIVAAKVSKEPSLRDAALDTNDGFTKSD